eukprot:m.29292 g.29292  ORF g.29292 m.29292 type:complete len:330 (-) comp9558_c0_seq1:114-1103(-)
MQVSSIHQQHDYGCWKKRKNTNRRRVEPVVSERYGTYPNCSCCTCNGKKTTVATVAKSRCCCKGRKGLKGRRERKGRGNGKRNDQVGEFRRSWKPLSKMTWQERRDLLEVERQSANASVFPLSPSHVSTGKRGRSGSLCSCSSCLQQNAHNNSGRCYSANISLHHIHSVVTASNITTKRRGYGMVGHCQWQETGYWRDHQFIPSSPWLSHFTINDDRERRLKLSLTGIGNEEFNSKNSVNNVNNTAPLIDNKFCNNRSFSPQQGCGSHHSNGSSFSRSSSIDEEIDEAFDAIVHHQLIEEMTTEELKQRLCDQDDEISSLKQRLKQSQQ